MPLWGHIAYLQVDFGQLIPLTKHKAVADSLQQMLLQGSFRHYERGKLDFLNQRRFSRNIKQVHAPGHFDSLAVQYPLPFQVGLRPGFALCLAGQVALSSQFHCLGGNRQDVRGEDREIDQRPDRDLQGFAVHGSPS